MLLPTTAFTVWVLAIVSLLCLGSWANTLKAGKGRFEYFFYDFVLGILLSAGVAALALGAARPQELTLQDNFLLTGYRKMAWALGSGVVLDLGTILLLAATALSGMSVAFPLTLGVALVIGTIWDFTSATQAPGVLLWGGVALLLAAVVCAALAYSWRLQEQRDKAQAAALRPDPRAKTKRVKEPGAVLAIVLAVVGGIALSIYPRTLAQATSDENGLAPYSAMLLLSISALVSSPFLVLFFTTFPIAGVAGGPGGYLSLSKKQHLLGVIGGILWVAGMLSSLLIAVAPRATQANPLALYALTQGAPVVAAAWGLLVWKEFGNASYRARLLMSGMLVLFLAGLGLVAFALFQAK